MFLRVGDAKDGRLSKVEFAAPDIGAVLTAEEGHLQGSFLWDSTGPLEVPEMQFPVVDLVVDDLSSLGGGKKDTESAGFDDLFLNQLSGQLDLDLDLVVKIPVLGKRKATHTFRVPIDDGVINFKELESGLARLEDAILDLAYKNGRIVLLRDIPLLPWDGTEMVYWELDDEGRALAADNKVRLRKLLHPKLPAKKEKPEKTEKEKKKKPPLRSVVVRNLSVKLSLGSSQIRLPKGGVIELGDSGANAVEELVLEGAAHYKSDEEMPPSRLHLSAKDVRLALRGLPAGKSPLHVAFRAREIAECSVSMNGFVPGKLTARLKDVTVSGLALRPV